MANDTKNSAKIKYLTTFEEFIKIMTTNLSVSEFLEQNISFEQNDDHQNHSKQKMKIVLNTPDVEIEDCLQRIKNMDENKFIGFENFHMTINNYKLEIEYISTIKKN
jgi:hypothetical protein